MLLLIHPLDPRHRKHREVLAKMEVVASRNRRTAGSVRLIVPTAVRVEAGWDRSIAKAAAVNRLRVHGGVLDGAAADVAARARARLAVSTADGHVAAVLGATPGPHAVVTSDVGDLRRIAHHMRAYVTTVRV